MNKVKVYAFGAWILAAILLGATWTQQSSGGSISVSAGGISGGLAEVENYSTSLPDWDPIENAVGSVTAGNLSKIHVADIGRYMVTVFLTDVDELIQGLIT
ncbi:hypothetical protein KEJ47_06760 [Candidatus Bathyarchaeota archaeon]|nr:hypothetical protein [Candidatus Bathyarchaeota archaeon]